MAFVAEIGAFQPLRQVCFAGGRLEHDVPLHQRVDAVGGSQRLFRAQTAILQQETRSARNAPSRVESTAVRQASGAFGRLSIEARTFVSTLSQ